MYKKTITLTIAFLSLLGLNLKNSFADDLIMARSTEAFPETMLSLQNVIKEQGYKPSRVQRVDIGLTKSGYKTDKYRVVFFGKSEEIKSVSQQLPALIPYLPLKISIFAEAEQTIIVTLNPITFDKMYPDSNLTPVFKRWAEDINIMFKKLQSGN